MVGWNTWEGRNITALINYGARIMSELQQLRKFYELKKVERTSTVAKRKESPAEHSWSCLILADYFLSTMKNAGLNRLRVYELLMYHDVVEIEAGDVDLLNEQERKHKKEREQQAAHVLKEHFPAVLRQKFIDLFCEYENGETPEARFARAIDALDAEIHELDYKEDWAGWTEAFLRRKKGPLLKEFPYLYEVFEEIMAFLKKEKYFRARGRSIITIKE